MAKAFNASIAEDTDTWHGIALSLRALAKVPKAAAKAKTAKDTRKGKEATKEDLEKEAPEAFQVAEAKEHDRDRKVGASTVVETTSPAIALRGREKAA